MNFESRVRTGLSHLLDDQATSVVIDSVSSIPGDERVLLVRFHLDGRWASAAGFAFPFPESVPLEESLGAFRESVSQSWKTAHETPATVEHFAAGS